MQFGICTQVENAAMLKAGGWDFVEEHVQNLLQGEKAEWEGRRRIEEARRAGLPILAANCLVPPHLKITGPEADIGRLRSYLHTVCGRAKEAGIRTLVFGSGGARKVPEGFPRDMARRQVLDFVRVAAELAEMNGLVLVVEHLNKGESNIINTVEESMEYIKAFDSQSRVQCLVDSYHLWLENEPLDAVAAAMPRVRHVHISERDRSQTRPGGATDAADYRAFFHVIKAGGYDGPVCVEAIWSPPLTEASARETLGYVRELWAAA